eukprot:TRINITY_DN10562_c0_g1_i10.p4 TRINITY_DN10562_c0_g1~~TRINITY_DN10562_c0_g1_i10.p4  ORF type:complete len:127 (+),score=24.00 TRINITY_DN10562_c0_g1_i10:76-456(+)
MKSFSCSLITFARAFHELESSGANSKHPFPLLLNLKSCDDSDLLDIRSSHFLCNFFTKFLKTRRDVEEISGFLLSANTAEHKTCLNELVAWCKKIESMSLCRLLHSANGMRKDFVVKCPGDRKFER